MLTFVEHSFGEKCLLRPILTDFDVQQHFRGAKLPLKPMHIWAIRVRLQIEHRWRDLALLLLYRKTRNLRARQLLLGHTKFESTVRYLGVELDDALEMSAALEIWKVTRGGSGQLLRQVPATAGFHRRETSASVNRLHALRAAVKSV